MMSARETGGQIGKHYTSVVREILRHRQIAAKGNHTHLLNNCVHRFKCGISILCNDHPINCYGRCDRCRIRSCNDLCPRSQLEQCQVLQKYPYVCNGCNIISKCILQKYFYRAEVSQRNYEKDLTESRSGFNLTREDIELTSSVIQAGNLKGQSLYHTLQANKDSLTIPIRTVYRLVNESMLRTKRGDMLMSCSRKQRKHPRGTCKSDRKCRSGRTYEDFLQYIKANPDVSIVEFDSVEGKIGGKILMSLLFRNCNLMLLFLRDHNTAQSVADIFDALEKELGIRNFRKLFPVILTENGSEFSSPDKIEKNKEGKCRTKLFYCYPYSSWEKGKIENNHTNLRKILPKGTRFENLKQENFCLVANHLNSYIRKSLNGKTPAERFECLYGSKILKQLNVEKLDPNTVIMSPTLLAGKI